VERAGAEISLQRDATVISYGAEADGIVTIARRAGEAAGSDQVLLAITGTTTRWSPLLHGNAASRYLQRRLQAELQGHCGTDIPCTIRSMLQR
jgi:hypothetical protein